MTKYELYYQLVRWGCMMGFPSYLDFGRFMDYLKSDLLPSAKEDLTLDEYKTLLGVVEDKVTKVSGTYANVHRGLKLQEVDFKFKSNQK